MLLLSHFLFPVLKMKATFAKKFSNFLRLLLAFAKVFVFKHQLLQGSEYNMANIFRVSYFAEIKAKYGKQGKY